MLDCAVQWRISRPVRYIVTWLVAALFTAVSKQSYLQPIGVVVQSVVKEAATTRAEHALNKSGANHNVANVIQHHLRVVR